MTQKHLLRAAIVCVIAAGVCLLAVTSAKCQERSTTPIKLALSAYAAGSAIDLSQTVRCSQMRGCSEQNPVYRGVFRSPTALSLLKGGLTSGALAVVWSARQRHPKLALGLAIGLAAGQAVVVASNARQLAHGR